MKFTFLSKFLITTCFALIFTAPLIADDEHEKEAYKNREGSIVVANRASESLSVINVRSDQVIKTIQLPAATNPAQPMYVVHTPRSDRIFVGDRSNNRVLVLDDEDYSIEASVPAGNGVFHMWADPSASQLWVNNDIDKTMTVIDPVTLQVLATVAIPADLASLGGKPHDVILDPSGRAAFVSIVGLSGSNDVIVRFDTENFIETARAEVGLDSHVSLTRHNKLLYVPCQNTNNVYVLKRKDLSLVKILDVPAAHGAGMPRHGRTFYTTNISGGGSNAIYAINTRRNTVRETAVDTPYAVPHNLALTNNSKKLYVTHSGASSDKVSVFRINRKTQLAEYVTEVTVGLNPFGLTYVEE